MKKLTAQKLYEAVMENQVPANGDIDEYFPDASPEIINLLADYWHAIDEVSNVRKRIRKLAQERLLETL